MTDIKTAFGSEWAEKYVAGKKRRPRLKVEGELRKTLIKIIKQNMKAEAPQLMYPTESDIYHMVLVETQDSIAARELSWGLSVNVNWSGRYMSAIVNKEQLDMLQPNSAYVLIGMMSTKPNTNNPGRQWINFRTDAIITMDEIAASK